MRHSLPDVPSPDVRRGLFAAVAAELIAAATRKSKAEIELLVAKRAVHARDGGRCTFVGESGRRREATSDLEYHHIRERARGGETSVDNLRLRCRPHNQHTAERAFGVEFMRQKRIVAAEALRHQVVERSAP